jgi:hypothetical protein
MRKRPAAPHLRRWRDGSPEMQGDRQAAAAPGEPRDAGGPAGGSGNHGCWVRLAVAQEHAFLRWEPGRLLHAHEASVVGDWSGGAQDGGGRGEALGRRGREQRVGRRRWGAVRRQEIGGAARE